MKRISHPRAMQPDHALTITVRMCIRVRVGFLVVLTELTKNPVDGFSVGLKDDDNIYVWSVMMEGPAGTD
jgi:hypothetical protein